MNRTCEALGTWNNTNCFVTGNEINSTANAGFICEWDEDAPQIQIRRNLKNYALYSASDKENINLYGWKTNITGNVYVGSNFIYSGSELDIDGRMEHSPSTILKTVNTYSNLLQQMKKDFHQLLKKR